MATIEELERRIESIEARNSKVSADKAWERSAVRRLTIAALTYIVVFFYLKAINNPNPWINAAVPTAGYLLSTLVLSEVRTLWVRTRKRI